MRKKSRAGMELVTIYPATCFGCNEPIAVGTRAFGKPAVGRRPWKFRHVGCEHRAAPVVNTGAWRENEEWCTEWEWRKVREAMAKCANPSER